MGICNSDTSGKTEDKEALARIKAQRRRLSVKPEMVGDFSKAGSRESKMDGILELPPLNEVEKKAKGAWTTCISTNKGLVPYNSTKVNQDRALIKWAVHDDPTLALFGVFDGHGENGHQVAQFVIDTITKSFELEKELKSSPGAAIKAAVAHTHAALRKSDIDFTFSGTTATFSVKIGNTIYTGNAGDSRTVLCRKNGDLVEALALSEDNKPEQPAEKQRILAAGGRVDPLPGDPEEEDLGPMRVWLKEQEVPGLAMSRSIGDEVAASVGVISDPVIVEHEISEENDLFIIWASDGVWEFISNQEAVEIVYKYSSKGDLSAGVTALCQESKKRWQDEEDVVDDITCAVLQFKPS